MNIFEKTLLEALKKDVTKTIFEFDKELYIKHVDGSTFTISYGHFEKKRVKNLNLLIVYGEHPTPMIFAEEDLLELKYKTRPRKIGRKKETLWIGVKIHSDFLE